MKHLIQKLNTMYQHALHNEHCDLYKKHYKDIGLKEVTSLADWQSLPFISKDILRGRSFMNRLFIPYEKLDSFKSTSGTSGKGVMISPRTHNSKYKDQFNVNITYVCVLHFFNPQHYLMNCRDEQSQYTTNIIGGDISNIEGSVLLAARAGLDSLMTFISIIELLIPILERHSLTNQIQQIHLSGERPTSGQLRRLTAIFPNAHIHASYHASESQRAIAVTNFTDGIESPYEVTDTFYWEIINEQGEILTEEGSEGEIITTQLFSTNNALPFLRYKTGDLGRIIKKDPSTGIPSVQILGRINLDNIKIVGGSLQTAEVDRAIQNLHPSLGKDFELYFSQITEGGETLPKVEIHILIEEKQRPTDALVKQLTKKLAEQIRVAPHFTFAQGITRGIYAPLTLKFVTSFKNTGGKKNRFFQN